MSKLMFYYGAMGSCKSLRLLTTAYNFKEKNIPCLCLKPSIDTRDGEFIRSRVGIEQKCTLFDPNTNLMDATNKYFDILSTKYITLKWILIDEAQFLTEKQVDQLAQIVDKLNVNVMCFGLRTDFQSKLFPGSKRLFELADEITEIKSSCECGKKASINARIDENENVIIDGDQVGIDGTVKYMPMCRKCWMERVEKQKEK